MRKIYNDKSFDVLHFDRENYDSQDNIFSDKTAFHRLFSKNLHQNIIYLSSFDIKNIKIDDIRYLKDRILKTTINKRIDILF